jgi:glycosyltransferase involved in cell wall biosynthesis
MTTISVIVPIWNRAHSVGRAINSVLSQVLPVGHDLEIIVVDDGSTDKPEKTLASFGASIRLVRHVRNLGAAAARNTGCTEAVGEYIAFLDSDDIWLPGKIDAQLSFMREHHFELSCTAYLLKRGAGSIVSPIYQTGPLQQEHLVWGCFVSPGSTLISRTSAFRENGPLDTSLRRFEDWDWLMRFARRGSVGFLATPLAYVEPSAGADPETVYAALEKVKLLHLGGLTGANRRHLKAAYHFERAAAYMRSGSRASALRELTMSMFWAPFGHRALAAVLHNRLARPMGNRS